jgi:hypothetical protein
MFFGFLSRNLFFLLLPILLSVALIAWCVSALQPVNHRSKLRSVLEIQFPLNWRVAIFCLLLGTLWSRPISIGLQVLAFLTLPEPWEWDFGYDHPWAAVFYRWLLTASLVCAPIWSLFFLRRNSFLLRLGIASAIVGGICALLQRI